MKSSLGWQFFLVMFCLFAFVLSFRPAGAQDLRVWTSSNGKHTFEAELLSQKDGQLKLKGKDGKVKNLSADELSDADQKFLKDLAVGDDDGESINLSKEQKNRLKKIGLRLARDEFLFIDERKLKSAISDSLKSKKNLIAMEMKLGQARLAQLNAENRIVQMKQENVKLNAQLANASTVRQNNQMVGLLNANVSGMELLEKSISNMETQIKEGRSFINKARDEFVQELMGVRQLSDSFDLRAVELQGDDEFNAALADIEKTLGRKMNKLGESKSLARLRSNLTKLEEVVLTDTIKLNDDGSGTFEATVSINGQDAIELVVDSGASLVTIPQRLASQLDIKIGPDARVIRMSIADGSVITGRLVTLDSVRMGKFTARNVECAVLGAEAVNAPNLLGMSFLGNFKFELDAAKGEMKMMTVETEE